MDEDEIRELPRKLLNLLGETVTRVIAWIFFVATVTAIIYGLISWCVLKKFRTFRNFVIISALIAYALFVLVSDLSDRFISEETLENNPALRVIPLAFFLFLQPAYQYWLIVLCYVFSVDFVKVFQYERCRKYLWSNLFAWGVPFITVLIYVIVGSVLLNLSEDDSIDIFEPRYLMILILIPVAVSFITYIAVIIELFGSTSKNNLCGRFTIATLTFAMSNVILFSIPDLLDINILAVDIIEEILEYVLLIALFVFIVVLKGNWKLWRDYLNNTSAPESGVMLGDQRI